MIDLFETARDLQEFCTSQGWRSCLIGGIAIQRWGQVRVTRDVDLCLLTGFGREEEFCRTLLTKYQPRNTDPIDFARRNRVLLLKTKVGTGIDVSMSALPYEERVIERSSIFSFDPDIEVRTCSAEDLIILKLFASRPLDVRDAQTVAIRHKNTLDWRLIEEELRPLAEAAENPAIMKELARIRSL